MSVHSSQERTTQTTHLINILDNLPLLQHKQRPLQRMTTKTLLRHELLHQTLIARLPPHRQPPLQLLLDPRHLVVQFSAREAVGGTGGDGVHGGELEEADGFFDVVVVDDGGEGHLGEGF